MVVGGVGRAYFVERDRQPVRGVDRPVRWRRDMANVIGGFLGAENRVGSPTTSQPPCHRRNGPGGPFRRRTASCSAWSRSSSTWPRRGSGSRHLLGAISMSIASKHARRRRLRIEATWPWANGFTTCRQRLHELPAVTWRAVRPVPTKTRTEETRTTPGPWNLAQPQRHATARPPTSGDITGERPSHSATEPR